MFLRSSCNFHDSETVSYKQVTYKKRLSLRKLDFLCSEKLDQSKCPPKVDVLQQ